MTGKKIGSKLIVTKQRFYVQTMSQHKKENEENKWII